MLDLKKRLGSLISNDSAQAAREAIQNALTVEWAGHKTVLIEVPASGNPQSDDVEMEGISANGREHTSYGRLLDDDDDEDERVSLTARGQEEQSRQSRSLKSPSLSMKALPPLPKRPSQPRSQSENPFYSPEPDEFIHAHQSARPHGIQSSSQKGATTFSNTTRSPPARTWTTFGTAPMNTSDPWNTFGKVGSIGTTSPSSSRGTTESGIIEMEEDPFR
ncbi:MAG: hypothetical protein TREMPRED_000062 [Tremellales sp. Tagirdzhanova-0007]|nr:MAG: hypothetical protein TREMPRED_000062 [Tremellales sp. Tagirdzhanova-0007]